MVRILWTSVGGPKGHFVFFLKEGAGSSGEGVGEGGAGPSFAPSVLF